MLTDDSTPEPLPPCAAIMGCLCCAHASADYPATAPCDAREPLALEWGLSPPPSARLAWGARAIYRLTTEPAKYQRRLGERPKVIKRARTVAEIDIPHDRQSSAFGAEISNRERQAFVKWINERGLPALKRACARLGVLGESDERIEIASGGYALHASPRGSHGYLYIVAWKVTP